MTTVLVDAGPLYAVAVRSDQHHARARGELDRLGREGRTVAVAFPTLLETHRLIMRRTRPAVAHVWLGEVMDAASELIHPLPEDHLLAIELLQRYTDQPITLFDAVIAVVSERLAMPVWSYDHHFDLMGINVWR